MLVASLTPLTMADGGRSTPDFVVSSFTLDDAGSINFGGGIEAEDATHVVRVQVQNIGLAAGQASLSLLLQGTANSGDVVLGTTNLGVIGAGASSAVSVFSWSATLGANQILKARITSSSDVATGNNEDQLIINVSRYQNSSVPVVDIPQPALGASNVVWSQSVHAFSASVRNDGVKNQSAQFWLNFTEVGNPGNTFSEVSNIVPVVRPGSLYAGIATLYPVEMDFDATSRTGQWDVVGEMHVSGLNWASSIEFLNQRVVFSNYDFEITAAHDRSVEPGQTAQLTFAVENTGISVDDYQVSVSSVSSWVSGINPSPSTSTVMPNTTTYVFVDVSVPANALRTQSDIITLTLSSSSGSFDKSVSTTILAGESYEGSVEMDSDTKSLTPGAPTPIQVKVQNNGNAPTAFTLDAGISSNPINWDLSFNSATTGTLQPGGAVNATLMVTPPVIKNPLVDAEDNGAGDTMSIWAQATSINGGIPQVNATPVRILPVIVVDPGLPTESIDMTVQQVIEAQQGSGLEAILDLDVEVRHNLITELSETVDTTLSLGTPVFTSDSTGGFAEASRWAIGLTPTSIPGMSLGETSNAVLTVQGPADDYSVSGSLSIPITATPTLGSTHSSANVIPTSISQTLTITIPPVLGAEGHNGTIVDAMVGEETSFPIDLANTGNNMTSYRLVLNDQVPDGWEVSFSSSSIMPSTTVTDLPADVSDYDDLLNNTTHITTFPLVLTTDPDAPANSIESIGIDVFEMTSNVYITSFVVPVRVGENVNAALSPTSQTVNLSIGETITTSVVIKNEGNTPATFGVYLDTGSAGEIDFVLETPTVVQIGAGYESTVRVRLTPTTDALAAANYFATIWVSNAQSGLNLSSDILGNISEQHGLVLSTTEEIGVVPGEVQTVDYSLINNGNLIEDVVLETSVADNWTVTPASLPLELGVGDTYTGSFDVDVPALGDDDSMVNGAVYPVTMRVLNATTQEVLETHTLRLIVAPLFLVEVENWPSTMDFHRGIGRTWDVVITNTGNKDVDVNVTYTLLKGGLTQPSLDWEMSPLASPTTLFLERGKATPFSFSVSSVATQPPLTLAANLIVTLDPVEVAVQGSAEYYTDLRMNRFFELGDTSVNPPSGNGEQVFPIVYSHIPTGPESSVAYEVELCRAERLIDVDALGENASKYGWTFAVRVDDTDYPLNMSAFCPPNDSLGPDSRITLPARQPWVTTNAIQLVIDAPNPPNILPGDGWDLTLRLYHPDENVGYSVFEDDVFTFQLAVFADPAIVAQGPADPDAFFEGQDTTYSVTVRNEGTAKALGVSAALDCGENVTILSSPGIHPALNATMEHVFTWDVRPATINWWDVNKVVQCDATLSYLYVGDGNDEENDRSYTTPEGVKLGEETVRSWSPDLSVAFIACVVAALLSLIFIRLASQSEKWQLGGIYTGVLAFGFAFHLFNVAYYGPAILALCALWIWRMTWKSSDEFRMIHEDYQRARKGTSTVYSDHFEALKDSRRQLTIILSLPVLGMLAIVLGLPPQLSTDRDNLTMIAAYFFLIMFGVWYLLKRSDKMYGNLFGRMTDAEIRSIRIERDLSDPARLLNDLADDGLDFSAILGEPAPASVVVGELEKQPVTDIDFESSSEVESDG